MKRIAELDQMIGHLERCIHAYPVAEMHRLHPVVEIFARSIDAIMDDDDDVPSRRTEPQFLPPRDDVKVRYKKDDVRREEVADYRDTLFDPDLI